MASNTVIGVFEDERQAHEVADDLKHEGFSDNDIHLSDEEDGRRRGGFASWIGHLFGGAESETESDLYRNAVSSGKSVVAVDTDENHMDRAAIIMERHGAIDVDEAGTSGTHPVSRGTGQPTPGSTTKQRSIPVVEEQINVGKRNVIHGGVRVYSHVTQQPVDEKVRLREEKVHVERHPVDRPVSAADQRELKDQTIEFTETREEPVVSKSRRVVEEVVVGKDTTERTETIHDNIQRTDVRVEPLEAEASRTSSAPIPSECSIDFRKNYEKQYGASGGSYNDYERFYDYGYRMAGDPKYRGKRFEDAEQDLRTDLLRNHPGSSWDRMRGAVRYGWERTTGKR